MPISPDDLHRARTALSQHLSANGLKSTRQRTLIAENFLSQSGHRTIGEMFARVRALDTRISIATVYRTMKMLVECGLAAPHQFGDGHTRFERTLSRDHHDHLICERCRGITEFEDEAIELRQQIVARKHAFHVTSHRLELYGLCARCYAEQPRKGDEAS